MDSSKSDRKGKAPQKDDVSVYVGDTTEPDPKTKEHSPRILEIPEYASNADLTKSELREKLVRAHRRYKICQQFTQGNSTEPRRTETIYPQSPVNPLGSSDPGPSGSSPCGSGSSVPQPPSGVPPLFNFSNNTYIDQINNAEIIRKAREEYDLDVEVSKIITDITETVSGQATYTYYKSIVFKILDAFLKISIMGLTASISIMSFRNSIYHGPTSNDNDLLDTLFIIAIIGVVATALVELRDQFMFGERSKVMRKCYHKFNKEIKRLRKLKFSSSDPLDVLDMLDGIEEKLSNIDMVVFDSQLVKLGSRDSVFLSRASKPIKNARPNDIPDHI